jgi:thymidylate kinase
MNADKGILIVIDAIDGAGKDTVAEAVKTHIRASGKSLVDLDAIALEGSHAFTYAKGTDERFHGHDALFVSQPTYVGIGKVIREEIMKERTYDALSTAQAFALDRQVLYTRTILPFLRVKPGRIVVQVRGLMSSLTYQTIQAEDEGIELTVEQLLELPGNALELSRSPDLTLLLMVSPETAAERLAKRTEKVDGDKFADPQFQARVSLRYRSKDVLETFERRGTNIVFIDAEASKETVAAACVRALRSFIET